METEIRKTEAQEKVEVAIRNIFPIITLQRVGSSLVGESTDISSLSRFHQLLRQQAILDTARSVMISNKRGGSTRLMLNKQVAFVGKVSFTDGEALLGPIVVTLEAIDIERIIDYLAPRTREGRPIHEIIY